MFNSSKYTTWYFNIVANARQRESTSGYTENHHIIPRSLGGTNARSNLVRLTYREHFVVHQLLVRMVSESSRHKMQFALLRMNSCSIKQKRNPTSRQIAFAKIQAKEAYKHRKRRENNSHSPETIEKIKQSRTNTIRIHHPVTKHRTTVHETELNWYLQIGYIRGSNVDRSGPANGMYGKRHSQHTIDTHFTKRAGTRAGEKNTMYGKTHTTEVRGKLAEIRKNEIWISNGVTALKIKKDQFGDFVNQGYHRGRK